ncbi:hypothetical protein B296_00047954 [Ensete ventricosum]|uniref:Bifunctional inhibitor/plant lipid transfer protein/seed storage helical domain-containing protein n=1 Tax=Ensete ventricosum TaxID=4639 RepID=A0A426YFW0_ENSVE|nr:hypothetical protein B296_00047954 [Ensete ventricosum]
MAFESGQAVCNMTQEGFDACKPSVTPPNPPPPSAACCKPLANADLPCLCSYKNSPLLPALGIDPGLAMKLPPNSPLTPPLSTALHSSNDNDISEIPFFLPCYCHCPSATTSGYHSPPTHSH